MILSVSAILAVMSSCMADTRYLTFLHIEHDGWSNTDTLTYTVSPLKGKENLGLTLLLHTEGYEYENVALEITIKQDTTLLYHEQHNYLLKQYLTKKGIGFRNDYTLPIGNIPQCDTIPTTIHLTHQLDQPILTGLREIGVCISSPIRQPGETVWKVNWKE